MSFVDNLVEVAVDSRPGHAELGRDLGDGELVAALLVDLVVHLPGKFGLPRAQLGFGSTDPAACPGGRETVHRSFGHQGVFELGDGSEYLEEHPADGGGGVDALVKDDQIDAAALEVVGQLNEMFEGTTKAVELGDSHLVTRPVGRVQCLVEFGPARELAAGFIQEHLVAARGEQGIVLGLGVLVTCRDPPISDLH